MRKNITEKTEIGLAAQSFMKDGKLVPDDVVLKILQQELQQSCTGKSILLDGFPRTTYQASKLKEFFNIDVVISLDIPHEVIIERLGNRWIHTPSSRTYSYDYNPPKVKGEGAKFTMFKFTIVVFSFECALLLYSRTVRYIRRGVFGANILCYVYCLIFRHR